jgi:hypothetical protein
MEPVRIRLYGLISITKRGYLMQLGVAGLLLVVLLVIRMSIPLSTEKLDQPVPAPLAWMIFLLANLHWFVLALALLFALEAFFVLRAFARAEASRPPGV